MSRIRTRALALAEIVTIMAVSLVLVAVCGFAFGPNYAKGRTRSTCAANLGKIATAYAMYAADNDGGYPMIGGIGSNPYFVKLYGFTTNCPLNQDGSYRDMYSEALGLGGLRPGSPPPVSTTLPDGSAIPRFDPALDTLVLCLDHGYEGFDRHGSHSFSIDGSTRGRVLGVRMDTSVTKVFPLSCWEFGSWPKRQIALYSSLWDRCDRPARR